MVAAKIARTPRRPNGRVSLNLTVQGSSNIISLLNSGFQVLKFGFGIGAGKFAALAQLVEQQFCKLWVVGSNPTGGSIGSSSPAFYLDYPLWT